MTERRTAAQDTGARDYLRIAAVQERQSARGTMVQSIRYQACSASAAGWSCRDFRNARDTEDSLAAALAAVGAEGWELVSAGTVEADSSANAVLWFKRARR